MTSTTETKTQAVHSLSLTGGLTPNSSSFHDVALPASDAPSAVPALSLNSNSITSQWEPLDPALGFDDPTYKYKRFLPTWSNTLKLPPLEPFEHVDPGLAALGDENYLDFLKGGEVEELTPDFGSEVSGVQLNQLDDRGRQRLARFVAERGVVAFRDQGSFIDADPNWQINDWTSYYGRPHQHPTSGQPAEFPELHLVYRDGKKTLNFDDVPYLTTAVWHSDVSYEAQPPGLTALFLYDSPTSGGDTGFADQRGAYNQLSPSFRAYLETLSVVHSGVQQADESRNHPSLGDVVKREPVENVHPLVRRHPVTGQKALYVNKNFSRRIVGLKIEESNAILNLLYDHIAQGADFQTRIRWRPGTVVLWDNRSTVHTAIIDFHRQGARRHGARLTPQAERPYL